MYLTGMLLCSERVFAAVKVHPTNEIHKNKARNAQPGLEPI